MPVTFAVEDLIDTDHQELEAEDREALAGLERLDLDSGDEEPEPQGSPQGADTDAVAEPATAIPKKQVAEEAQQEQKTLVDLPTDVLREIVKEVNHTNDLTNLCLTCRCLHTLAIPHIYSRFDIVWPDAATTGERTGVDALTFGLSTLVKIGKRGNDYARWIKKFSLGNGPIDWVNEYNINKEGGKMLCTLVELAVTKMQSLETFSWDMPTGVLRDVFMALHDLNGVIKNVHVRFHDNRETTTPTSQDPSRRVETPTFKGFEGLRSLSVLDIDEKQYLEEISFAVEKSVHRLKELRIGLAPHVCEGSNRRWIRDWDDLEDTASTTNDDEPLGGVLGIIVGRVVDLKAGRRQRRRNRPANTTNLIAPMGMANVAVGTAEAVVMTSAAPAAVYVNSVDVNAALAGDENVSANITSLPNLPDFGSSQAQAVAAPTTEAAGSQQENNHVPHTIAANVLVSGSSPAVPATAPATAPVTASATAPATAPAPAPAPAALTTTAVGPANTVASTQSNSAPSPKAISPPELASHPGLDDEAKPPTQLKLNTLELERVPISVWVLTKAIDWSVLSSLTILNCYNHEKLWKALRRKYSPIGVPTTENSFSSSGVHKHGTLHGHHGTSHRLRGAYPQVPLDYTIRLKKLHTDCVTPHLIAFIRDTLPPNSLEELFLQDTVNQSTVSMENIYKGALRRHRESLRKLLIDSKNSEDSDSVFKWIFAREHIAFVSSGKMPRLRELACAIDYKDWHYLLTRLTCMPHLRSLYITHTRDSPHISNYAPRELAQQILNTIILRPEIELCYIGMMNKCYEVLEGPLDDVDLVDVVEPPANIVSSTNQPPSPGDDSEEEDSDAEDEDEDEDSTDDVEDVVSDPEEVEEEDERKREGIRLREILFYDDKVAVFRARSAKL